MKELSIEEKARRYDEAIERAKEINREHSKKGFKPSDDVLYIFPELKESEDERVRNKLIEFFKGYSPDEEWWGNITQKDILAWLEKQGEQKPAWSERYITDVFEKVGLAKIVREQGDENLAGALQSALIELGKFMPQQKPWSEEDEEIIRSLLDIIYECHSYGKCALKLNEYSKLCDWLKSLKDKVQPKQAWCDKYGCE